MVRPNKFNHIERSINFKDFSNPVKRHDCRFTIQSKSIILDFALSTNYLGLLKSLVVVFRLNQTCIFPYREINLPCRFQAYYINQRGGIPCHFD